ncbi:MAG: peptidoglycan DD-metalloendopeptidase family protein [Polyangiaceae bacterium]|nr:peptidoglycan DD-metalloendopeptidase family protein [Polyangiaceae bacterium]
MRRALRFGFAALLVGTGALAGPAGPAPAGVGTAPPAGDAVDALHRELERLTRDDARLEKRAAALAQELERIRARTLARGRSYVRLARAGLLPVGGGFEDLVDHAARVERLRRALARDVEQERALVDERARIAEERERLRKQRLPLEAQAESLARASAAVAAAQERDEAFARAFSGDGAHAAVYGAVGPAAPAETTGGFAALRGRLPLPLAGRTEVRRLRRSNGAPGVELRAPYGSAVRSVHAGRVAFADLYADYGRTVIVDHGANHFTVSANLSEISVAVGDDVVTGTRLGGVGDAPGGPSVYFEIRVGAEAVDPGEWLGL